LSHSRPLQFLQAATHGSPCLTQEHCCVQHDLGVVVLHLHQITLSMSCGAASFYRSGRSASEEVVLQLIISKCIPVILYGLEACTLTKSDLQLYFVINRFLMKLFKTNNTDHVKYCQHCFSFDMPSDLWQKRVKAFESKFSKMYIGLP